MTRREPEPVLVRTMKATTLAGITCEPFTENQRQINWNNSSDRKWLTNHLHWAMLNGRGIQLFALNRAPNTLV